MKLAASTLTIALLTTFGCGDKSTNASSSASGSAAAASTGSGAKSNAEPPKDGDPAVVAELKKVADCAREENRRKSDCASEDGWRKFAEKFVEEDDMNLTKQKKLAKACFSMVGDANANIRELAFECLIGNTDALEDPKGTFDFVFSKLETETNSDVQGSMFNILDNLDPTKLGTANQVLALAKKLAERDKTSYEVGQLLGVLTPEKREVEPSDEAFAFAVELLTVKKRNQGEAVDLIVRKKSKAKEGCAALLALVETKKNPWARGLDGMANVEGTCKEQHDKAIEAVITRAGQPDGYDQGFIGADVIYFTRLAEKAGFSAEQKGKLRPAIEPLLKAAKEEHKQKSYQSLLDVLK